MTGDADRLGLQVDHDEAAQPQVVEQQAEIEIFAADLQVDLPTHAWQHV